jgi:hypothetical protein
MKPKNPLLVFIALLAFSGAAKAADRLMEIPNDITSVSLDGKSHDMIVKAYRENYNAHSYYSITFYNKDDNLQLVPIERSIHKPLADELTTSQGADCVLVDYRLAIFDHKTYVVEARRDFGETFGDTTNVQLTIYSLTHNSEGLPGWPSAYFSVFRTWKAKKQYCDVTETFDDPAVREEIFRSKAEVESKEIENKEPD